MRCRLVSARICPYAQRNWIVLLAKGVDVEVVFVDLFDKPDWLFALSPAGKVPLLEVDGEVLAESNVINEFLEEVFAEPRLHPDTPLRRARHRMWVEAVSPLNLEVARVLMAPDEGTAREAEATLRSRLQGLEGQIAGPFFAGPALSLVDAAAAPALVRLAWATALEPTLDPTAELPRVRAWSEAVRAHPAVARSSPPEVHEALIAFLKGGGSPRRSAPSTWLGRRAG